MPRPAQLLETLTRTKIPVGVRAALASLLLLRSTWAEQIQNSQFKILKPHTLVVGVNPKSEIQNPKLIDWRRLIHYQLFVTLSFC